MGAAALDVFELGARTFEVVVMEKRLQPPDDGLLAAAQKRGDLVGTKKTMAVNEPDDGAVALGQVKRRDGGNTPDTG